MLLWLTPHVVHAVRPSSTRGDSLEVSSPACLCRMPPLERLLLLRLLSSAGRAEVECYHVGQHHQRSPPPCEARCSPPTTAGSQWGGGRPQLSHEGGTGATHSLAAAGSSIAAVMLSKTLPEPTLFGALFGPLCLVGAAGLCDGEVVTHHPPSTSASSHSGTWPWLHSHSSYRAPSTPTALASVRPVRGKADGAVWEVHARRSSCGGWTWRATRICC